MISNANRYLFALAGFALVAFFGYWIAVGERAGTFLLFGLFVGAATLALVVTGATLGEPVPEPVADGEDAAPAIFEAASTARPSMWPLAGALALGLAAVGTAVDGRLLVAGLVLGIVPAAGWLGQVWREHASWTDRLSSRLEDRVLVPVGLPVGMIVLVLSIAFAVSRVLLALPEKGSTAGALIIAVLVLFGLAFIAARLPRLRSSALIAVAALAAVAVVAAGSVGAAQGERKFENKNESAEPVVDVTAHNTAFDKKSITVPAHAKKFEVVFDNLDTGIYHNVAFYKLDGSPIFNGKPVPGGKEKFEVTLPAAGKYEFLCDFHPSIMKGDFVVK
ncbi:MAG: cupredoxin domain-containing protein [Actinobacteria bacterium]|nr:cupredoxin domain-containing protein [Actinomycetota bacterium]MBV9935828.1 cupredoxin domain-containing protein [Actinomycetota bacterium]